MTELPRGVFDDLEGRFEARLRDHRVLTRTSKMREGEITVSSSIATLEAKFDFEVLDRLHDPCFVAIERPGAKGITYVIYEVVSLRPTHFQMLGMDVAMPTVLRKEYLDTISSAWGRSDETWIDVGAVPTQYAMNPASDGISFSRTRLIPLIGSRVHLLSKDSVRCFLCVEDGVEVGSLLGFDMPLHADIENMVKYHMGIFGFTGVGKSNLSSFLVRRAIESIPDLNVVIFDVAGEYAVHLIDLVSESGKVFSTEDFRDDPEKFLSSQAVPETLEENIGAGRLEDAVGRIFQQGLVEKLSLAASGDMPRLSLGYVADLLRRTSDEKGSGSIPATMALQELSSFFFGQTGLDPELDVSQLSTAERGKLTEILSKLVQSIHSMSALSKDIASLINYVNESAGTAAQLTSGEDQSLFMNPSGLATYVLGDLAPRLNIIYVPEPDEARICVSDFIHRLLLLKKTVGLRKRLLVVLDEAQEFVPDRVTRADYTDQSNRAVEALLRQGRKYRAHCWISTQRVAHLNVNALQQLHTYFVSTLPRFYDRMVIADAFSLSYDVLDRTTELETGEWLFVSYKATKQKNVPAFIKAANNEEIVRKALQASEQQSESTRTSSRSF